MHRLRYVLAQTLSSLRESPGISALTSATIAAALLLLGAYAMLLLNLEGVALVWGRAAGVAAIVAEDVSKDDWEGLRAKVAGVEGVTKAVLVSPSAAMARFRERGPEARALVDGVPDEVMPATIEIDLESRFVDVQALDGLAARVGAIPGIRAVDYGKDELAELQQLVAFLRWVGLAFGLGLTLATAFIVSSTIRLAVYARRDEIAILRLVGATPWFIRAPFLLEGAAWGLGGGLVAISAGFFAEVSLARRLSAALASHLGGLSIRLMLPEVGLALVLAGLVLGVFGSALAVRRFLDVEPT